MEAERWQKIKGIFDSAVELDGRKRADFLEEACAGDDDLRGEVEKMLGSFDGSESFLESPTAADPADQILESDSKLSAGQIIGHYEIVRQIGVGGMGEVYLAKDNKLDRSVAIKILNEKFSAHDSNLQRFTREAKAASALNHPNILVIHEIGESDNTNYIVSEFVTGKTLREVIEESPMKISEILDTTIQIAGALAAAHGENIIHRDIKPENIMVRPDGYVKVLDFGLAKLIGNENSPFGLEDATQIQNQTAQGVIIGTVNYMSPEQAKGQKVDARTDIFSLGVLLYEMIAGRNPFARESLSETLADLINADPPPLSRFASKVPDDLQKIVSKTLRKNRDDRYQTMKGLLGDLKELKESLTFDEKLERTKQSGENETAVLKTETARANKQTAETLNSFTKSTTNRKTIALFGLAALLLAMTGIGFWYFSGRVASSQVKSLAVLPLKSLDAGENFLGLGIADAIIRRINQTGELIVRPTSSVRHYLNEETDALTAARQLNADAVLEGSVQRSDGRLRVTVNLLRTSDGVSLWSDSFDMRSTDIFTIQDTVGQQVASRLRLKLDPSQLARLDKRYTSNPVAYEFYVRGVYTMNPRDRNKQQQKAAIDFFKKAIETDPNFALAHAQLAYAYAVLAIFIDPAEEIWVKLSREEINLAQAADPQLAETHLARSLLLWSRYEGYQNEASVRELLLAAQLNPNVGQVELGSTANHIGLEDFAARELHRAFEIDPTNDFAREMDTYQYQMSGRYDEWLTAYQNHYPNKPISAWYFLGKGRLDEAQKALDDRTAQDPEDTELPRQKALLLALKGDFTSAEAAIPSILSKHPLKDLNYHHAAYDIACIYALAGKSEEAVKWLREAAETGFPCYPLFERDAYLNRIRETPQFTQFMTEMKAQYEKYRNEFSQAL